MTLASLDVKDVITAHRDVLERRRRFTAVAG
jgi:hypothetical protein